MIKFSCGSVKNAPITHRKELDDALRTQNIDDICRNTVDICTNIVEICRNIVDILSFLCTSCLYLLACA